MMNWDKYGIEIPYGRTGGNVKVRCPNCRDQRHDKRDKSLSCDLRTGMFKCHYCGFSGCANEPSDIDKQRWKERQPWYNPNPIRKERPNYKKPKPTAHAPMSERALAWFASRGISKATVEALKITEGLEYMPQKNGQANTVQFNYFLDGELVNTKFRTGDKCFKLVAGARLVPYNIDAIKGESECIITEGEMDAASFVECSINNVVSVPNGANSTEWLDDFIVDYFEDKTTIYIASDTDTKGTELRDELIRRFGAERCRVLEYGEGCKDANEHLQRYGKASLLECLANAPEIRVEGIFKVSDFEPNLDALFEHGMQRGVTIGHDNFDRLCSFETKRLCIVTGIPSSGKSEFIDEIAERLNIRHGWRFAFFSPENAPLEYHASKLIEKFTGKHFDKDHLSLPEYRQVKHHLENNFFFISPEDYRLTTIFDRAKFLVRRKGIKCLVIDPYNRLEDEQNGLSGVDYIRGQLKEMLKFAQKNDILIILMAHPTKPLRNKDGVIDAPTLYDISGSADFFNMTDFGIVVHRNRQENTVEVHIQKVKFKHLGECGTALFKYNMENGRYASWVNGQGNPIWDNTNHLVEDERKKAEELEKASRFTFDILQQSDEEAPF